MNHLRVHLINYLKLRRGLGFKLDSAEMLLRSFIRFAEGETSTVRYHQARVAMGYTTAEHQTGAKWQPSGHGAAFC